MYVKHMALFHSVCVCVCVHITSCIKQTTICNRSTTAHTSVLLLLLLSAYSRFQAPPLAGYSAEPFQAPPLAGYSAEPFQALPLAGYSAEPFQAPPLAGYSAKPKSTNIRLKLG